MCSQCGLEKELKYFWKDNRKKDGIRSSCIECCKQRYQDNKSQILKKCKEYRKSNKKVISQKRRERYEQNKEKEIKANKEYRTKNHKKDLKRKRDWRKRNPNYYNEYLKNPLNKLKHNIRNLMNKSLRKNGVIKSSKTFEILGCSFEDFKIYLFENAKLKYPEFTFEDYLEKGKYHIDHIIPLYSAKNENEVLELCHFSNLQILLAEENLSKNRYYE